MKTSLFSRQQSEPFKNDNFIPVCLSTLQQGAHTSVKLCIYIGAEGFCYISKS